VRQLARSVWTRTRPPWPAEGRHSYVRRRFERELDRGARDHKSRVIAEMIKMLVMDDRVDLAMEFVVALRANE